MAASGSANAMATTEIRYEAVLYNGSDRQPEFQWCFRVPTPLFLAAKAGNMDALNAISKHAVNIFNPVMLRSEPVRCFHCTRPAHHVLSNIAPYLDPRPRCRGEPIPGPFQHDLVYAYCSKGGDCEAAVREAFSERPRNGLLPDGRQHEARCVVLAKARPSIEKSCSAYEASIVREESRHNHTHTHTHKDDRTTAGGQKMGIQ
jgi:hypothetical protein